jgi:hypothetical protein
MAVVQLSINQISNPADQKKLLDCLRECSSSMTRMDGEKDYIRESIASISKDLQLPKKLVAKLVKVYHKQNYDEEVATHEQFETLYETIVK